MIVHNFRVAFPMPSSNVNEMRETESPRRSSAAARSIPSDLSHLHGRTDGRTDGGPRCSSLFLPFPTRRDGGYTRAGSPSPTWTGGDRERERERQAEEAELHFPLCCVLVRSYESRFQVFLLLRHRQRQREDHVCLSVGLCLFVPFKILPSLAVSVGMS